MPKTALTDIVMSLDVALTTVQNAPIGACPRPSPVILGSMYCCTFSTRLSSAGCLSLSIIITLTVVCPFQRGITLASPTPSTSFAHLL